MINLICRDFREWMETEKSFIYWLTLEKRELCIEGCALETNSEAEKNYWRKREKLGCLPDWIK